MEASKAEDAPPQSSSRWAILGLGLGAIALALGRAQTHLFEGNQATYFLHGLADAGRGRLAEDWLAGTADPTPVFSALLASALRHLPEPALLAGFPLLALVFFAALLAIGDTLLGSAKTAQRRASLVLLALVAFGAESLCLWSPREAIPTEVLISGVAEQRVLGRNLEPSTFGVLLVLALALALKRREFAATVAAVLAATLHPTYLLPAGCLVLGAAASRWRHRGRPRQGAGVLLAGALLVLPIALYVLANFAGGDGALRDRAAEILARQRFPHHAVPEIWWNARPAQTAFQIGLALSGLLLCWRTPLRLPLVTLTAFGLAGTALTMATESDALALLFPWRVTTLLVPVATMAVLALFARHLVPATPGPVRSAAAGWGLVLLAAAALAWSGVQKTRAAMASHERDPVVEMMTTIARDSEASSRWMVPPRALPLFRLLAERPIHADRKSHPYAADEVVAWAGRLQVVDDFYRHQRWRQPERVALLGTAHGLTHFVLPAMALQPELDFEVLARSPQWVAGRFPADPSTTPRGVVSFGRGWDPIGRLPTSSTSRSATLDLALDPQRRWRLRLRGVARLFSPDIPAQRMEVRLGEQSLGSWRFDGKERDIEIALPADIAQPSLELELRFPDARSPAELGMGPDRRRLALRVLEARLIPAGS